MREILFRGKDLQEHNGWLYGYFYKSDINKRERESGKATLIFTPNCDTFIYVPEYHNSWMVKPETLGEYVALKDKNGLTKIFEYDIIDANGRKVGNYYENSNLLKDGTCILVAKMGTKEWSRSEQEAIKRGCKYAE